MIRGDGIVVVTGSNGRIGEAVMRRFAGRFDSVVGFDRKAPAPPPPGGVYIPVEITSDDSVRQGLRTIRDHHGAHVASVVHLAAYYDFFGEPSAAHAPALRPPLAGIPHQAHAEAAVPEVTNDTLVGALVIVFAILAPGMPGMRMLPGPDAPPGWSYNPSSWPQRAPVIALALVGFFLSRHMTAFQLEHITSLRDPVFGSGTERVLTSEVSRAFQLSTWPHRRALRRLRAVHPVTRMVDPCTLVLFGASGDLTQRW